MDPCQAGRHGQDSQHRLKFVLGCLRGAGEGCRNFVVKSLRLSFVWSDHAGFLWFCERVVSKMNFAIE
jgi:hypothetical protein